MQEWITQYWIQAGFAMTISAVSFGGKWMYKNLEENKAQITNIRQGLLSLLRNSIIKNYDDYKEREYIPIYALENVEELYKAYHNLGGNGTITKLHDELMNLPSKNQEG